MGKGEREGVEVLGPNVKPGAGSTEWIAKTKNQKQREQASPARGFSAEHLWVALPCQDPGKHGGHPSTGLIHPKVLRTPPKLGITSLTHWAGRQGGKLR